MGEQMTMKTIFWVIHNLPIAWEFYTSYCVHVFTRLLFHDVSIRSARSLCPSEAAYTQTRKPRFAIKLLVHTLTIWESVKNSLFGLLKFSFVVAVHLQVFSFLLDAIGCAFGHYFFLSTSRLTKWGIIVFSSCTWGFALCLLTGIFWFTDAIKNKLEG